MTWYGPWVQPDDEELELTGATLGRWHNNTRPREINRSRFGVLEWGPDSPFDEATLGPVTTVADVAEDNNGTYQADAFGGAGVRIENALTDPDATLDWASGNLHLADYADTRTVRVGQSKFYPTLFADVLGNDNVIVEPDEWPEDAIDVEYENNTDPDMWRAQILTAEVDVSLTPQPGYYTEATGFPAGAGAVDTSAPSYDPTAQIYEIRVFDRTALTFPNPASPITPDEWTEFHPASDLGALQLLGSVELTGEEATLVEYAPAAVTHVETLDVTDWLSAVAWLGTDASPTTQTIWLVHAQQQRLLAAPSDPGHSEAVERTSDSEWLQVDSRRRAGELTAGVSPGWLIVRTLVTWRPPRYRFVYASPPTTPTLRQRQTPGIRQRQGRPIRQRQTGR